MEKRALGDLAQDYFAGLCSNERGLVANPAIRDRRGWDFVLEFPPFGHDLPRDLQNSGETVFVQVKATEGSSPHQVQVKLSNALIFAQRPEPCFFILFHFNPHERQPTAVYLKHFYGDLIERTMSRVRQAEAAGEGNLNRLKLSVAFKDADSVATDDVIGELRNQIRSIPNLYSQEKQRLSHFSGLENGLGPFGIEFEDGITDEVLVDLCLGLRESIPVKRLSPRSQRFGVTLPFGAELSRGELSMELTPQQGVIVIPSESGDLLFSSCEIFSPNAFPFIAKDKLRIRMKNDFLDVVASVEEAGKHHCSLNFNPTAKVLLPDLETQIYMWLHSGKTIGMQFWLGSCLFLHGECHVQAVDINGMGGWTSMNEVVRRLKIAALDPRWPLDFKVSCEDLVESRNALQTFAAIRSAGGFDISLEPDDGFTFGNRFPIFLAHVCALGDCQIVSITRHQAEVIQRADGQSILRFAGPAVDICYVLRAGDVEQAWKQVEKDLESQVSAHDRISDVQAMSLGLRGEPKFFLREDGAGVMPPKG